MDLSEVKELEHLERKAQLHELAQAIRRGAQMKPQGFAGLFSLYVTTADGPFEIHSCAIGAAYDACFGWDGRASFIYIKKLSAKFPLVRQIGNEIVRLNDKEHWTRERIADWVERQ